MALTLIPTPTATQTPTAPVLTLEPATRPTTVTALPVRAPGPVPVTAPDRFDCHQVDGFLAAVGTTPGDVVVDLSSVRFVDVAGLDALLGLRASALERGHDLYLSGLSDAGRITLELAGLDEAFPFLADRQVAA